MLTQALVSEEGRQMATKASLFDWDNMWFRGSVVITMLIGVGWGTRWMSNQENAVERLTLSIAESTSNSKEWALTAQADRDALRATMREGFAEVKVELQRISLGSVQTRQADTWIEQFEDRFNHWMAEVMLTNPNLKLPSFKPPALPK